MSTTQTPAKPRYRVPSVSVDADVSLDEFSIEEIRKYLQHINGDEGPRSIGDGLYLSTNELDHIETLVVCGQIEQARKLALEIVGEAIGRPL